MKKFKNKRTDLGGIEKMYNNVPEFYMATGELGLPQSAVGSDELLSNAVQGEGSVPVGPSVPVSDDPDGVMSKKKR